MNTFRAIAASGSTSIVTVAPGIAEALINTAAGLAAAIPAVNAYNAFLGALRRQRGVMEDFLLDFLNLTERTFTEHDSYQLSALSYQLSALSFQRSAFSAQRSAFSAQRSAFSAQRSASRSWLIADS
ncbi:MAG: MotA/TolQ/ExbB proton channel family protein, partial [Acidobacteriota bacterium]